MRSCVMNIHPCASNEDIKEEVMRNFSDSPTMIQAMDNLTGMRKRNSKPVSVYISRFDMTHKRATQLTAAQQDIQIMIIQFAKTLKRSLQKRLLRRIANPQFRPNTLRQAFNMILEAEREIQITDVDQPTTQIMDIQDENEEAEIQEASASFRPSIGRNNFNSNKGNFGQQQRNQGNSGQQRNFKDRQGQYQQQPWRPNFSNQADQNQVGTVTATFKSKLGMDVGRILHLVRVLERITSQRKGNFNCNNNNFTHRNKEHRNTASSDTTPGSSAMNTMKNAQNHPFTRSQGKSSIK